MDTICDSHSKQQTMIFVQNPLGSHSKQTPDDMSVEILLLAAIGVTTPIVLASGHAEMLAIPGAILAAVIALLKAIDEKRGWSERGIQVVGTTVLGSTAPTTAIQWWYPDAINKLAPQAFFLLGFVSGLIGWILFWAGYLILDRRKEKVMNAAIKEAEKRMGVTHFMEDTDSKS